MSSFSVWPYTMTLFWPGERKVSSIMSWEVSLAQVTVKPSGESSGTFDSPTYQPFSMGRSCTEEASEIQIDGSKLELLSILAIDWLGESLMEGREGEDTTAKRRGRLLVRT